ncbi:hypothetical protein [Devosia sp.]|uniref:hypothetical protein n=1 Tax=Devosia sp. TaxID=1871048 RepID=UPI001AD06646|nr:hypothetical protein [Devosia sp.]MBN9335085.1 hypothetical protein [Devosia sp.]
MRTISHVIAGALLGVVLAAGTTIPSLAQKNTTPAASTIDFGDDSSDWAKDGECDDPRFVGKGAATELVEADRMKDATDCRAAYEAGTVTLKDAGTNTAATTATATEIDFGDDSSEWAKDGECDDPRFVGTGAATELVEADRMKDATDCRAAYEAGTVTLKDAGTSTAATTAAAAEIDFGDDSSKWAKDGECDDPRFVGTGAATELVEADRMKDATDCRAAFEAGTVTLKEGGPAATGVAATEIDFGDDSSDWAKDGECDDPRFVGTGAATELVEADRMKDATDCRAAYEAGTVTLKDTGAAATAMPAAEIDFGDDSSEWAKDGECDDPRFVGTGSATQLVEADRMKDATDCRAAFEAGTVTLKDTSATSTAAIDYGDDSSEWAKDGECDDPRFTGKGVATTTLAEDIKKDATDCRAAVEAGTATYTGERDAAAFDFGSDFSKWANDGQCDDLRFEGPGVDKKLLSEDLMGDATDCRTLLEEGKVSIRKVYTPEYAAGAPYDSSGIDFGDNSSSYSNDDECDDPRFEGPGTATTLLDSDRLADADDCRAAYEAGTIVLIEG